jgi:hypothetical protein
MILIFFFSLYLFYIYGKEKKNIRKSTVKYKQVNKVYKTQYHKSETLNIHAVYNADIREYIPYSP